MAWCSEGRLTGSRLVLNTVYKIFFRSFRSRAFFTSEIVVGPLCLTKLIVWPAHFWDASAAYGHDRLVLESRFAACLPVTNRWLYWIENFNFDSATKSILFDFPSLRGARRHSVTYGLLVDARAVINWCKEQPGDSSVFLIFCHDFPPIPPRLSVRVLFLPSFVCVWSLQNNCT